MKLTNEITKEIRESAAQLPKQMYKAQGKILNIHSGLPNIQFLEINHNRRMRYLWQKAKTEEEGKVAILQYIAKVFKPYQKHEPVTKSSTPVIKISG